MYPSIFSLLLLLPLSLGSKILMIPGVATSQCLEMAAIGQELLQRGHEVTLLSIILEVDKCTSRIKPDSLKQKLKVIAVNVDSEHREKDKYFKNETMKCIFERKPLYTFLFNMVRPRVVNRWEAALSDKSLWGKLEKENFDLAMVDGMMFMSCFATIAVAIDVPFVSVGANVDPQDSQTPLQSNTLPHVMSSSDNEMTFLERLLNAIAAFVNPIFRRLSLGSPDLSKYNPFFILICMPIHAETFTTAIKVKKYQIGSSLNIFDDSVEEMARVIKDVMENASYSRNMKRMSMLHRDRPETAPARAASAIEHVFKYGGAHLQPPSHIGFISYIYADVWFVIFKVCTLLLWFDIWLCRKCCCGSKTIQKQKHE